MVKIYSKALKSSITVNRLIGKIEGVNKGPTIVFFGGIHGNETAGIFALKEVFSKITSTLISGTLYGISGNLEALKSNQRYVDEDLNRIWLNGKLKNKTPLNSEQQEQQELYEILQQILREKQGPFYFIDLHTTSSKTLPFITINDALINRKFSSLFPVPIVLGIEEYLEGPLLSYINQLGYVSLGFESGQHDDINAVINSVAFIFLSLVFTKTIERKHVDDYKTYYKVLAKEFNTNKEIFEVVYLYRLLDGDDFKMKPNFKSFQNVKKGEVLAKTKKKNIYSPFTAKIFMPLYQTKGKEGFFIIKSIPSVILWFSEIFRKIKLDTLLVVLPGISWKDKQKGVLKVNLKVTKYLAKQFFHLLGYRNKQINGSHMFLFNRERTSKKEMYKNLEWYKKRRPN